jgi:hypothetical protein
MLVLFYTYNGITRILVIYLIHSINYSVNIVNDPDDQIHDQVYSIYKVFVI